MKKILLIYFKKLRNVIEITFLLFLFYMFIRTLLDLNVTVVLPNGDVIYVGENIKLWWTNSVIRTDYVYKIYEVNYEVIIHNLFFYVFEIILLSIPIIIFISYEVYQKRNIINKILKKK